jgi:hypothetical protein
MTIASVRSIPRRLRTIDLRSVDTWRAVAHVVAAAALAGYAVYFSTAGAHAGDAHAYWAADLRHPYTTAVNETDAYLYSPAFLLALLPLKVLPWAVFWPVWTMLNLVVLWWLVGPVLAVLLLLPGPFSPVWVNFWYGNIAVLMAAALLAVFRWPGAWSFLLLTKVTPGVGLVWFAVRREWRYLTYAAIATIAIVVVSFAVTPQPWLEWPGMLASNAAGEDVFVTLPPLWLRVVLALGLVGTGGLFSARWTVPLAAVIAQPVFWFTGFTMLIAWLGLLRHRDALLDARLPTASTSSSG